MKRFVLYARGAAWESRTHDLLAAAGFEVIKAGSLDAAATAAAEGPTVALLADAEDVGLEELCSRVRGAERTENVALLVVVRDPTMADLDRAFRLGIEDYVAADGVHQIRAKAVALASGDPWTGMRAPAGRVVLAHPDRTNRLRLARVVRHWGFDLSFAENEAELEHQLRQDPPPRAVLADGDLPPQGAHAALGRLRSDHAGGTVPWIVLSDPKELEGARQLVQLLPPALAYDRSGPPENIIFALNDLFQARAVEARRSPRVLYGAPVAFRTSGDPEPVWAYAYNVNRTGLYVRTLVPPPLSTVLHLRFRPPFGEGLVAMDAQVMWRKEYGAQSGPMYPTGMGVQFVRRPLADDAAFLAGYDALLKEAEHAGTVRKSIRPNVKPD